MTFFFLSVFLTFIFACLVLPHEAGAEIKEFKDFSVDLPQGWVIKQEGVTTAFIAADGSANMQVVVEYLTLLGMDGMQARELAEAYAAELHGSVPVMVDNDPNYYSFEFKSPDGINSEASVVVVGNRFYIITITGRNKALAGMVESVLLSIM
ncbi:MAG: hypothetical protein LBN33_10300 [Desulfovibrio sp.]|nr:hypothetical protein [Desulfovibrio sp.]